MKVDLELGALEQLVEIGQTRAIADTIVTLSSWMDGQRTLNVRSRLALKSDTFERSLCSNYLKALRKKQKRINRSISSVL